MTSDSQGATSEGGGGVGGPGSDYAPSTPLSTSGLQAMSPCDDDDTHQAREQSSAEGGGGGLQSIF